MRSQLSATFTTGEVQIALKQLTPLKAPGLDGMPPLFYQNFWNLTGNDVTESFLKFFNSTSLPEQLNHTFITLILKKKKNPECASDFRPISLFNVLYKKFSKVLANRLSTKNYYGTPKCFHKKSLNF